MRAVLFVNFDRPVDFEAESELRQKCLALRSALEEQTPAILRAVRFQDAPLLEQAISILKPTHNWAAGIGTPGDSIEQYFATILDSAMGVVGMTPGEGFGTVHLFQPESERLVLAAFRGNIDKDKINSAKVQSVFAFLVFIVAYCYP